MINVALPADLEKRVNETVARGEFPSREKFFEQAAELLLRLRTDDGRPVPVEEQVDASSKKPKRAERLRR